ncbi:MAG: pyruvate dehydrogenase (acetyl-transferring) E1 component subunit alpha [Gammaproteobacteria bacterium]|nr:pyruvate dehydrogenase (acetyl-transferring) E1 component subunit alpha [Gammaproteobacteria bacterium]
MQPIAHFEIYSHQFLNSAGDLTLPLPPPFHSPRDLLKPYQHMLRIRAFDSKAVALQRTGQIGTFPSSEGEEASMAGIAFAMQAEDVFLPSYREHGVLFARGVSMEEVLLYWGGDERGSNYANARQDFPIAVPIATQVLHAVGVATAFKLKGEKKVAVTTCGDGGSSRADFNEGLNFAGVWQIPLVVVVVNNQWAISVPRSSQSKAATFAQKAIAAGMEGIQVDGNDLIAMTHVCRQAVDKARTGAGPTLIEAVTYRMAPHTTADDASRYRGQEEVNSAKALDPILRLKTFLMREKVWSLDEEEAFKQKLQEEVNEAAKAYQAMSPQPIESIFDYLYAKLPRALEEQKAQAVERSEL